MKKCGIYIIKNKINDLVYIGQSVDINMRWIAHKNAAKQYEINPKQTDIHKAMYLIGINNFYYEILEECNYEVLSEREIYWISKYNSYKNGYNMTPGGESCIGEANGRHILTTEQVEDIRMAYNNHIPFREVFKKYENVISKRGLQKVWNFETWKHVMPEVYTDENRLWHKTAASAFKDGNKKYGYNNKARACSEEEIKKMRDLRQEGLSYQKIAEKIGRCPSVVRKYCLFEECKNLNKNGKSIMVKNLETGLVFESLTSAAKWAKCDRHDISKRLNTNIAAGFVPTTGLPAHWIKL